MRRTLFLLLLLLSASVAWHCTRAAGSVYRVSDRATLSFDEMVRELRSSDVIFLGEVHDVPAHHAMQYRIIKALNESGVPIAIGLEMFRAEDQRTLNEWTRGALSLQQFLPSYYANWRMAWPLYRDIFLYARDHRIPMVGLNIPESVSRTVAERGFGALTPKQLAQVPKGVSCNVDARYREFIRDAYSDHVQPSDRNFNNFCEAQLVWDQSMAWHIASYRMAHTKRTIVVLTGVGHAWRRGIPEQLIKYAKLTTRVVLPAVRGAIDPKTVTSEDADYIMWD